MLSHSAQGAVSPWSKKSEETKLHERLSIRQIEDPKIHRQPMFCAMINFCIIFLLLYLIFNSSAEAAVLIFPKLYAMSGGLLLQWILGYNFSVRVWSGA